jgi:hypothetical protein
MACFHYTPLLLKNGLLNPRHHRGHVPLNLIIPESDNPQPHLTQNLFPPGIFLLLQIVDVSIHLHNQPRLVTIEVNNEALYNLLSPEMNTKLIRPQFFPQDFLGGSHFTAKFLGALKFLRGDFLIRDDVFDRHGDILLVCSENGISAKRQNPSPVSPKGEKLRPSMHRTFALPTSASADKIKVTPMPFPSGKGQLNTTNHYANWGKVR